MDRSENATTVVYICWDCGRDFEVSECDGLTESLEVTCPVCRSDLVAVDFAEVRRRRVEPRDRNIAGPQSDVPQAEAAS